MSLEAAAFKNTFQTDSWIENHAIEDEEEHKNPQYNCSCIVDLRWDKGDMSPCNRTC